MKNETQIVTVLTGDLVNSTALGAEKVEMAFERLQVVATELEAWHGSSLLFTRHRGDGWQVVLHEPKYTLRSILAFRACLKAIDNDLDSYVGASKGVIDAQLKQDLNSNLDKVFQNSGYALEMIKKHGRNKRFMIEYPEGPISPMLALLDFYVAGWTAVQAETVFLFLTKALVTYSEAAKHLGKSRQTVQKTLAATGFAFIEDALMPMEHST